MVIFSILKSVARKSSSLSRYEPFLNDLSWSSSREYECLSELSAASRITPPRFRNQGSFSRCRKEIMESQYMRFTGLACKCRNTWIHLSVCSWKCIKVGSNFFIKLGTDSMKAKLQPIGIVGKFTFVLYRKTCDVITFCFLVDIKRDF